MFRILRRFDSVGNVGVAHVGNATGFDQFDARSRWRFVLQTLRNGDGVCLKIFQHPIAKNRSVIGVRSGDENFHRLFQRQNVIFVFL